SSFKKIIMKKNTCVSFNSTRLVIYNLEAIILKLNIILYISTLLKLENTL
ncbi:hypothetical protein K458DRAFT_286695, partial [Lentithecium fluviatile CBS 122367]